MPLVGRPEKQRELTFVERDASDQLRLVMEQKKLTFKKLARALESYGVTVSHKTLSNRVGRGQFSFAFFLLCLRAAGLKSFRVQLGAASAKDLAEFKKAESWKAPRKAPLPSTRGSGRVSTSGTTNSGRSPRR